MKHRVVKVSVTTTEGELLDAFLVSHWTNETIDNMDMDAEGIGSKASESLLMHRIKAAMGEVE